MGENLELAITEIEPSENQVVPSQSYSRKRITRSKQKLESLEEAKWLQVK